MSWKFAEFELLSCLTELTGAIKKRERAKKEKKGNEKVVINTIKHFLSFPQIFPGTHYINTNNKLK